MATKNIVASKIASRCTVQLSYAIGKAGPTSLMLDLHGTGLEMEAKLDSIEIYRKFAANVGLIKAELTSLLNNLKGQGARTSLIPAHERMYKHYHQR
jgi:S-adenosylmethionine synthetase